MNFKSFETENFDDLVFFMSCLVSGQRNQPHSDGAGTPDEPLYVVATGGGAYKYFDKIQEALGVEIYREDEMECPIVGWSPRFLSNPYLLIQRFRSGFLRHGNTVRGVLIQRRRSNAIHGSQGRHISLPPCEYRVWGEYD